MKINLVKDTINKEDIDSLCDWLKENPRLTMGEKTLEFERKFAEWNGNKYALFVNSGSSANFLAAQYFRNEELKSSNVIVPAISWATTVSPFMILGFNPILCDADPVTLGIDPNHLEDLCKKYNPSLLILVHVLGIPCNMDEIVSICEKYNVEIIEDCCEALGSKFNNKKVGTFGKIGTFSAYFGHHFSTIEGGVITTDSEQVYETIKMLRAHGWTKNNKPEFKNFLQNEYRIDEFQIQYTFFLPSLNFRSTDLNAHIGLEQLKRFDEVCEARNQNFNIYNSLIKNNEWKYKLDERYWVSNFSYPIISKNRTELVKKLNEAGIENRPLICGSMGRQPFFTDIYGVQKLNNADIVHYNGIYVPNYYGLERNEIEYICEVVNNI